MRVADQKPQTRHFKLFAHVGSYNRDSVQLFVWVLGGSEKHLHQNRGLASCEPESLTVGKLFQLKTDCHTRKQGRERSQDIRAAANTPLKRLSTVSSRNSRRQGSGNGAKHGHFLRGYRWNRNLRNYRLTTNI